MPFWKKNKSEAEGNPDRTFKERVDRFWKWFSLVADDYFEAIEAGNCGELATETSIQINEMSPNFAWVFGPGPEEKGGHSLTISGEGVVTRQFLAEYCIARAPELPNWTFYAARQPGDVSKEMAIGMDDDRFDFGGLWVTPKLNEENEIVDITAWHPTFATADSEKSDTALFIMLDEILGEHGTDNWLGVIERSDTELAGAIPVLELRDYLHDLEIERGWRKLPPTETFFSYNLNHHDDDYPRSDTIAGSTSCMSLVGDFLDNRGPIENDPIEDSGADFIFVSYPTSVAPQGEEVDFRAKVEDALVAAFVGNAAGQVLGGAVGTENSYIDLLIFDGDRSLELILNTLRSHELPEGTAIQFFCDGNEGRRLFL